MTSVRATTTAANSLRKLLTNKGTVTLPGVFNGLTARSVEQAGFEACYIGGSTVSAMSGQPDIGMVGLDGFCAKIREISNAAPNMPIFADADTGFGEEEMTTKTTLEYFRAGASGLHLEDQVFPKRCGHLGGKSLVESDRMVDKIQRAVEARNQIQKRGGDFVVCARTDAYGVMGFDDAVERSEAYAKVGADMIFPEGLNTREEFQMFSDAMKSYRYHDDDKSADNNGNSNPDEEKKHQRRKRLFLLANMTEFGTTETISVKEFEEMGYDAVIFPASSMRVTMKAVTKLFSNLRETGTVGSLKEMQTRDELYNLLNYNPGEEWVMPL